MPPAARDCSLKKCQDRGGHANLIRVMEVIHAKADGSVFIVMEFVDGGNLYDAMKKETTSLRRRRRASRGISCEV